MPTLLILPNLNKLSGPGKALCEQAGASGSDMKKQSQCDKRTNCASCMMKRIALASVTSRVHDISVANATLQP